MSTLRLFDVSNFIHTGSVNTRAIISGGVINTPRGWKPLELKSGGLSMLFRHIKYYIEKDNIIMCLDNEPTAKRALCPQYKAHREKKPIVEKQKEIVRAILKDCKFQIAEEVTKEAEDAMFEVIRCYKDEFKKIVIHSADSDTYAFVDDKVSIGLTGDNSKEVTIDNYEYTVKKGQITPYNVSNILKMIHGDQSDNVKALSRNVGETLKYLFINNPIYQSKAGDRDFVFKVLERSLPQALLQAQIIFPLDCNTFVDPYTKPDLERIKIWGYIVGCNDYSRPETIPEDIQYIIKGFFE